jgi:hypothetical protein
MKTNFIIETENLIRQHQVSTALQKMQVSFILSQAVPAGVVLPLILPLQLHPPHNPNFWSAAAYGTNAS